MYTDKEIEELEQEEYTLTEEMMVVILLTLGYSEKQLKKELRSFFSEYGKDGIVTYYDARKWVSSKDHTRRLTVLEQLINSIFDDLFNSIETEVEDLFRSIISKEAKFFNVDIDIDEILELGWGTDGLSWKQRLNSYLKKWKATVNSDVKLTLIKRESIGNLMIKMGKRCDSMDTILTRFIRSEGSAISSLADKKIYEKLGVKEYMFISMNDDRTCNTCYDMHGILFPLSEYKVGITANPLHPYCRCRTRPIME